MVFRLARLAPAKPRKNAALGLAKDVRRGGKFAGVLLAPKAKRKAKAKAGARKS
jgi:hypothetical protein